jgi:hypothetical protein
MGGCGKRDGRRRARARGAGAIRSNDAGVGELDGERWMTRFPKRAPGGGEIKEGSGRMHLVFFVTISMGLSIWNGWCPGRRL